MTGIGAALAEVRDENLAPQEQLLDPFGWHHGVASRIVGLGGNAPGHDPAYVFHTPYVEATPGPCHFTLRFQGLAARRGVLQLRVHMLPLEPGAHARLANSDRVQLNRLVQMGGQIAIGFEGFRGFSFAVMGLIADDTDAEAAGLEIVLDRPAGAIGTAAGAPEGRTTTYGRDSARPATHLISTEPPSLADPVSQLGTRAQLREAAFRGRQGPLATGSEAGDWSNVYVLQVLKRYGVLAAGARGLGLVPLGSPLPAAVAAAGVDVTAACAPDGADLAVEHDRMTGELARAAPQGADHARGRIEVRAVDPGAPPGDLADFDFLWSVGVCARAGDAATVIHTVEQLMSRLRPGGLAVHVLPFDLAADGDRPGGDETLLARAHVERLALNLISRNHEVAQIRIDRRDALLRADLPDDEVGMFGIVARRPSAIV